MRRKHARNGKPRVARSVLRLLHEKSGIALDVACGENKVSSEWVGIDVRPMPGVDIVHDLEQFPWPLPDGCVNTALVSHYVEHINPASFGVIKFFDELWRVLKPGARVLIVTPYAGSPGYWQDPTHINPMSEASFAYMDPTHQSGLWGIYRPRPWRIVDNTWQLNGNLECLLERLPPMTCIQCRQEIATTEGFTFARDHEPQSGWMHARCRPDLAARLRAARAAQPPQAGAHGWHKRVHTGVR